MNKPQTDAEFKDSTSWMSKYRALGPGVLMASAAVGTSHLIASTQAGAIYGWQLAIIIILVNLFKYPFFRFGSQYTLLSGQTLLDGYKQKGTFYLVLFFALNVFSTMINIAAVGLICAAVLTFLLPIDISLTLLGVIIIAVSTAFLIFGHYRSLDWMSRLIMLTLTIFTFSAVIIAAKNGAVAAPDYIAPSPWNMASLGFIVALMGWMPAPIEVSVFTSLWVVAKRRIENVNYKDGIFDFNVGFIGSAILALIFLALGALVQFGSGEVVQAKGVPYIQQLINMYANTIGDWSRVLIAFIAFGTIFGTVLTVIDGYARASMESMALLFNAPRSSRRLSLVMLVSSLSGIIVLLFFQAQVGKLLNFAMISSFLTTPIFAALNLILAAKGEYKIKGFLLYLSYAGLIFLCGFTILFLLSHFKFIG